jgi:glutaredoxin
MSEPLILFTRPDCELCERAAALLISAGLNWQYRDISNDLALLERYGQRIPVVRDDDGDRELGWPFDLNTLQSFAGERS